jgi:Arc/MetJ-type ribon-helix-helix transcriptional regulator
MPSDLTVVTVKLPNSDLRRMPPGETRSQFIRAAVAEKLARLDRPAWRPKTALGRKLLALSDRFEGERLDSEGIAEELRRRRGGLS